MLTDDDLTRQLSAAFREETDEMTYDRALPRARTRPLWARPGLVAAVRAGGGVRAGSGDGQSSTGNGGNRKSAANVACKFRVLHGCVLPKATFAPSVPGHLRATVEPVGMEVVSVACCVTVCGVGRPGHSWAAGDAAGP